MAYFCNKQEYNSGCTHAFDHTLDEQGAFGTELSPAREALFLTLIATLRTHRYFSVGSWGIVGISLARWWPRSQEYSMTQGRKSIAKRSIRKLTVKQDRGPSRISD